MPRRDPGGGTWRCNNPACLAWTWVTTSREGCFLCQAPAPRAAKTRLGFLLAKADLGHREVHGFVPLGAAADDRVAPARVGQPAPWPVGPPARCPMALPGACRPPSPAAAGSRTASWSHWCWCCHPRPQSQSGLLWD